MIAADNALSNVVRIAQRQGDQHEDDARTFAKLVRANLRKTNKALVTDIAAQLLAIGKKRETSKEDFAWSVSKKYTASVQPFSRADLDVQWNKYIASINDGSRFFNKGALDYLRNLFKDSRRLKIHGLFYDLTPICEIPTGKKIFRARLALTSAKVDEIRADPQRELGAPAPTLASAGRMNAERTSVFYGAFEEATAAAELRPPLSGQIVVGEFRLSRPLKILDFRTLEISGGASISIWNPEFKQRVIMRALLQRLHDWIKRPVRPGSEHEYLATQVLAEYLSVYLSLDGVLFGSAQRDEGTNLAVFGRALGPFDPITKQFSNSPLELEGPPRVLRIRRIEYEYGVES